MKMKAWRVTIRIWKIAQIEAAHHSAAEEAEQAVAVAAEQRDQDEDQLAGVHVAEQPHAVRDTVLAAYSISCRSEVDRIKPARCRCRRAR
jgi:hypothetical protein